MEDICDQGPECREPAILAAIRIAAFEYQGIVLVHGQQAFAAAGRSKNDHGVTAWRIALAPLPHDPLRDHRGLPGECAEFSGNHFRNVPAGEVLRPQRIRNLRQLRPRQRQRLRIRRLVDLVAERYRLACAQTKQVARRQGTDHAAGFVDNAEVTGLEAIHAADGAIDEGIRRDRSERLAHDLSDRRVERGRAGPCDRTQQIALGHDACVRSLEIPGSGIRPDIDGGYSLI